jgi:hypothetical protein
MSFSLHILLFKCSIGFIESRIMESGVKTTEGEHVADQFMTDTCSYFIVLPGAFSSVPLKAWTFFG